MNQELSLSVKRLSAQSVLLVTSAPTLRQILRWLVLWASFLQAALPCAPFVVLVQLVLWRMDLKMSCVRRVLIRRPVRLLVLTVRQVISALLRGRSSPLCVLRVRFPLVKSALACLVLPVFRALAVLLLPHMLLVLLVPILPLEKLRACRALQDMPALLTPCPSLVLLVPLLVKGLLLALFAQPTISVLRLPLRRNYLVRLDIGPVPGRRNVIFVLVDMLASVPKHPSPVLMVSSLLWVPPFVLPAKMVMCALPVLHRLQVNAVLSVVSASKALPNLARPVSMEWWRVVLRRALLVLSAQPGSSVRVEKWFRVLEVIFALLELLPSSPTRVLLVRSMTSWSKLVLKTALCVPLVTFVPAVRNTVIRRVPLVPTARPVLPLPVLLAPTLVRVW